MPDRDAEMQAVLELEAHIERFAKFMGYMNDDSIIDDWVLVGSSTSMNLVERDAHSYFLSTRNNGIPMHRTVGMLQVGMDYCEVDNGDDDD